jgi:hypothetical protein
MASINWNQYIAAAEAAGESLDDFTPVPANTYEVNVLKAEAVKTKGGNGKAVKDMLKLTLVIEGGPHAGRRLWSNQVFSPESPKAVAIFIRTLKSLGAGQLMDSGASFEQIAAGLQGALATVKVSVGEYQGKPKNEVDSIAGRTGGTAGPNLSAPSAPAVPAGLPV